MQAAFQDFGTSQGPRFRWWSRAGLWSSSGGSFPGQSSARQHCLQHGGCTKAFPWFLEAALCCSRVLVAALQELTRGCTAPLLAVLPCKGLLALCNESSPLRSCCGGAGGTNSTSLPSWGCGTHRFWPPQCTWPWSSSGKHPKELLLLLCSSSAGTMRVG